MQINHGCGKPCVAHKHLNLTNVIAGFQQMGSEGVTQGVYAGAPVDTGFFPGLFIDQTDRFISKRFSLPL